MLQYLSNTYLWFSYVFFIFVLPACSEQDLVVTTPLQCICVPHACVQIPYNGFFLRAANFY